MILWKSLWIDIILRPRYPLPQTTTAFPNQRIFSKSLIFLLYSWLTWLNPGLNIFHHKYLYQWTIVPVSRVKWITGVRVSTVKELWDSLPKVLRARSWLSGLERRCRVCVVRYVKGSSTYLPDTFISTDTFHCRACYHLKGVLTGVLGGSDWNDSVTIR